MNLIKALKKNHLCLFILLTFLSVSSLKAQPFREDIEKFKKQDSISPPPNNAILFIGSSSFTMWTDVKDYFPKHTIVNRAFGGSSLPDVIRYANEIIFPYHAKQVVIYCGENDLAASDSVTATMVCQRFVQLFELIRTENPAVPIVYVSLKPSPARWHLKDKMVDANNLIKGYLQKKDRAVFVDVYNKMINADGKPMKELFLEDNLHMNAKGYSIWKKAIEPTLSYQLSAVSNQK
jgi:lysophospholipase L1-like esterase